MAALGIGAGSWMSVVMGIDLTFGVASAVREVAGRCWAVAAAVVLSRRCRKPGWGTAVTAAVFAVVAGMVRARRTIAVELTADRIEDMVAAVATGSWAAVARMGPRVRRYSNSSSRCLGTKARVHQRESEDRRWGRDEACRTWHWPECTYWTDAPRACGRST